MMPRLSCALCLVWSVLVSSMPLCAATVTGEIVDQANRRLIPARLYIQAEDGRWFFAETTLGSAIRYEKRNWIHTNAVEMHVTLSAHPFRVDLPPGVYTFTVERGKEYRPLVKRMEINNENKRVRLPLTRWVDMSRRGWFSGDTHVHRPLADLANVMLAEDLNVAFPLTYWVTKAFTPPAQGDKNLDAGKPAELIRVDPTHVIWPRNTEWEIFTVGNQNHHLGAVFALGHRAAFTQGAPPVGPIAEQARREGALLDLDKHDWPWSMAIVPLMNVDLYELANNHIWRTEFAFSKWSGAAENFVGLPGERWEGSEREWIEDGFRNYYVLLNCGFRLRPSAGTANGVHPVPLGFGRVYVECPRGFSYEAWWQGLNQGRSFVTTGPMLIVQVDGQQPGARVTMKPGKTRRVEIAATVISDQPVETVEIIVNGQVAHRFAPESSRGEGGERKFRRKLELAGSSWIAVRCWEPRAGGRIRFAHTAPWFFDVPDAPLRPSREEIEFLCQRVREQIERSSKVIPEEALVEYRKALAIYEEIARQAR